MEDKQTRLLTLLSVVLIVLVGLIVFVDPPKDGVDDDDAVKWERIWPEASSDGVNSVALTRGDGQVLSFAHGDAGWTVSGGADSYPADAKKVENLIDGVLTVETAVDEEGLSGDPTSFGLAPPVAVVSLTRADGSVTTLRIGRDTPVGYGTYVQREEGGPVLRARSRLSGSVGGGEGGTLADFRDRSLVSFVESEVSGISVLRPDLLPCVEGAPATTECGAPLLKLDRDEHGWWLRAPTVARVDEDRIDAMLGELLRLRADAFEPGATLTPALTLELTVGDKRETLSFGPEQMGRLASVPAQPELVRVGAALPEALTEGPEAWLDDALLPVRRSSLTKLQVRLGADALDAERGDAGWSSPQAEQALDALEAVRIDRKLTAEAPTGEVWGSVDLLEGETRKESVKFFQALADGSRVARDDAGGAPFLVSSAELKRLTDALAGDLAPADGAN